MHELSIPKEGKMKTAENTDIDPWGSWECPWLPLWKPLTSSESALTADRDMLCQEHQFRWGRFLPHRLSTSRQHQHVGEPNPEPSWKPQPILPPSSDPTWAVLHVPAALQTQGWEHPCELQLQQCREDTHYRTSPVLNRRDRIWLRQS